jgi:hypothetical protein
MPRGERRSVVAVLVAVAALTVNNALAAPPTQQIEDFYYPDGTPVLSDGGMPFAHAALFRFHDRRASGIMWQIMTQNLAPGSCYDIWIESSDDGTSGDSFRWWVGRAMATPRGDLDAVGLVGTAEPPGEYDGQFSDPGAPLFLLITTTDGEVVQAAFFPGA